MAEFGYYRIPRSWELKLASDGQGLRVLRSIHVIWIPVPEMGPGKASQVLSYYLVNIVAFRYYKL